MTSRALGALLGVVLVSAPAARAEETPPREAGAAPTARVSHEEEPADRRRKTVVLGIVGRRDVDGELAQVLSDIVQTELARDADRLVLGPTDLKRVLGFQETRQRLGCDTSSCLSEVASALDADRLVTGSLDRLGASYLLVLTEIDARTLAPLGRVDKTLAADEEMIAAGVRAAAIELVALSKPTRVATTADPPALRSAETAPPAESAPTTPQARAGPTPETQQRPAAPASASPPRAANGAEGVTSPEETDEPLGEVPFSHWLWAGSKLGVAGLVGAVGVVLGGTGFFMFGADSEGRFVAPFHGGLFRPESGAPPGATATVIGCCCTPGCVLCPTSAAMIAWGLADFLWPPHAPVDETKPDARGGPLPPPVRVAHEDVMAH